MAHFSYTAKKDGGDIYHGTAEVRDRFELYQIVRREGAHVLNVTEEASNNFFSIAYWNMLLAHIGEYEKILFARNLGAMLSAGLALARALSVIERQTKNIKLARLVADVASDVRRGTTFHDALTRFPDVFPPLFIAMVRAGEESGNLAHSLTAVSDQMERMYNLKKKVQGAFVYPSIIILAIIGIGGFMMVKVVPTLSATFLQMKVELPFATRSIIFVSDMLVHNGIIVVPLAVLFVVGVIFGLRTRNGTRVKEYTLLHLPIIGGLVREVNAARTSRTLASLLSSGVDVMTSLEITADVVQNSYFRSVILEARQAVATGGTLSSVFIQHEGLYPPFVGEMMSVGEETGTTNDMLTRLAQHYEDEVELGTKDMSTVIEPFLMLFVGAMVGFFAVAMISPIYQLTEHI
jgi:type IV pilus assembly protein PilC